MKKRAIIAGATGLIGKELVKQLVDRNIHEEIVVIVRSKQAYTSDKIIEIIETDFSKIEEHVEMLDAEDYYCALGTTIKKAGSKEAFRQVDYDYPLLFAKLALRAKRFRQFGIVTAVGADASSSIFYNQVKGELERDLKELGLKRLNIFQPNLLLGDREELRLGELLAKWLSKLLSFFVLRSKDQLWAIPGKTVARAMINASLANYEETRTYKPTKIKELGS